MIRKIKIALRLAILIGMMVFLVLGTIGGFYLGFNKIKKYYSDQFEKELLTVQKDKVKALTYTMSLTISNLIKDIEDEEQKIKLLRKTVDEIKYEKDSSGYYFIYKGTVCVAHPDHQYYDQDLAELKDVNDVYFIKETYELSKNGGGYLNLIFNKPGKGDQPKVVYVLPIADTDYWVASGLYMDNVEESRLNVTGKIDDIAFSLLMKILVFSSIILFLVALPFSISIRRSIVNPIRRAIETTNKITEGNLSVKLRDHFQDEIGEMNHSVNTLIDSLNKVAVFAQEIGKGNLEEEFELLSDEDILGNSLLEMRKSLKIANEQGEVRKLEDQKQNWATQGFARFGEILRQNNDDMQEFSYHILSNLVKYIDANQGGIFIINDDDKNDEFVELLAFYAYDRRKYLEKRIEIGVGLIGGCAQEQRTIYMTDLPEKYINVTSGVGQSVPNALLIVPLKLNDKIFGVIELAGFNEFKDHVIKFVEEVGESIASTISTTKVNIRTNQLLEQSQQQSEQMASQEEEMRQNMEELQATQEEAGRKSGDMQGVLNAFNSTNLVVEYDLNGYITKVNDNYLKLASINRDQIIGTHHIDNKNLTQVQKEENKVFWEELRKGIAKKETDNIELDNKKYVFVSTYTPVLNEDGNPEKVLKVATDITELIV